MVSYQMPKKIDFEFTEIHKKIGQMIFMEPGDSDINEGNFMAQLWFITHDKGEGHVWWLIGEWDTRVDSSPEPIE